MSESNQNHKTNDYFVIEPCTSANGIEVKLKNKKFNLDKCAELLKSESDFEIISQMQVVLLAKSKNFSISIYESGRIMIKEIKNSKKIDTKAFGKKLADLLGSAIF